MAILKANTKKNWNWIIIRFKFLQIIKLFKINLNLTNHYQNPHKYYNSANQILTNKIFCKIIFNNTQKQLARYSSLLKIKNCKNLYVHLLQPILLKFKNYN